MSRSYKKHPTIKCGGMGKYAKKLFNKRIRKIPVDVDVPQHRQFKKMNDSCEIWDYSFTQYKEWEEQDWYKDQYDIINNVHSWKSKYNPSLEEALADWKKFYKCK